MKKLVVVLAAMAMTVCAKAAAIDWSASKVVDPWASETAGKMTAADSWIGYVVLAADLDAVTGGLDQGKTDTLVAKAVGPVKTSTNKGAFNASAATGNVAAGEQNFYLIVLNASTADAATHYAVSSVMPATVDASLDTTVAFGSMQAATQNAAGWSSMNAPEPTSGILLLLGMAGLALKRKRA